MKPELDTGFAARVRTLCPTFRTTGETLPARKSELLVGEIDGERVVAKRLARPNAVWEWYLSREIAIYRAFDAQPPPVRVPKLYAAAQDVLVIERLPGAPIATRRSPLAELDERVLGELLDMHERFARWSRATPLDSPTPEVRSQLRSRFLEDPTSDWIRIGIERAVRRELLPARLEHVELEGTTVPSHGDLLLRNAIADGEHIGLVDWECAGPHLVDWDLALLWTQLHPDQRAIVEEAARSERFLVIVAFALAREVSILLGFRVGPADSHMQRLRREIDEVCSRIPC